MSKAHETLNDLRARYGFSFMHNPGGGEFYRSDLDLRFQLSMQDDEKDLEGFVGFLREHNAEGLDEALGGLRG